MTSPIPLKSPIRQSGEPATPAPSQPAETTPLLALEGVSVAFGGITAVRDVSFDVRSGEVIALIGPSGAGKSTLLRTINHLEPRSAGSIRLAGAAVGTDRRSLNALRRDVGMVFQHFNLFPHLTAIDNVALAQQHALGRSRAEARERALRELVHVGLEQHAAHKPAHCSGGQQQRIAIARALAMDPKVMLFDEPTSALDPELGIEVLATMRRLADEGMTMIIVTHEVHFAEQVADRVIFMCDGEILEQGPPAQLLHEPQHARVRQFLSALRDR